MSMKVVNWSGIAAISCKHPFSQAVRSRVLGYIGCKICSLKVRGELRAYNSTAKRGSILDSHPEYLQLWDYERNELDPQLLHSGSTVSACWLCKQCGQRFEQLVYRRLRSASTRPCCQPSARKSRLQTEVADYISQHFPALLCYEDTRKVISPLELDFYFPGIRAAVEVNGGEGFYHATKAQFLTGSAEAERELLKQQRCREKNIELLHVWESDGIELIQLACAEFLEAAQLKLKAEGLNLENGAALEASNCPQPKQP